MQYIENENVYLDKLIQHPKLIGFYKTSFNGLWVSRDGDFYSDEKDRLLFVHMTKKGYPTIRFEGQNRYVHILLADTFIKKPEDIAKPWVNHRNGNKHDFRLNNLEWTTPSKNLIHAFKNNLRRDNKAVLLKDLLTGVVMEFNGLNECSRYLGKNSARPSEYLNGCNRTPLYGRYDLIWKSSTWNPHTREDLNRTRPGVPRSVVAFDKSLEVVTIYRTVQEAAIGTGIDSQEITKVANGNKACRVENLNFKWYSAWVLETECQNETRPFSSKELI